LNLFNNNITELNEEFFMSLKSLKLIYLENNMIESIYFFTYIGRYCHEINKIYLKNNRMINISNEDYELLMMILNNHNLTEISLDDYNLNHNKIINANDDEILRINKFNFENSKIYYTGENSVSSL
jgi:Leucine-rich repeat (LRR) protein